MDETRVAIRRETARRAAEAAGEVALDRFRGDLAVERKSGKTDVVTEADREAQRRAREAIEQQFDEPLVGEENDAPSEVPAEGPAWIVDPIDGTNNFVRGVPMWSSAVAAVVDAEPVAAAVVAPALGDTFVAGSEQTVVDDEPVSVSDRDDPEACSVCPTLWWPRDRRDEYAGIAEGVIERFGDLRRFGSAQLELALTATGGLDATITNVRGNPWDTVAGAHLVRKAGGRVTDLQGQRWRHDGHGLVASNGEIHEAALAAARAAEN